MKIKSILALAAASLAALLMCAQPAAAQFVGQPTWLSDPSGVCSYPGRSGCGFVENPEPYPYGATAETSSSGDVAAATAAATIAKASAKTTYLSGLSVTGGGATGASIVQCTIVGVLGGTLTFNTAVVAGATLGNTPVRLDFNPPLPSSTTNTDIVVSCPTLGSGNAHAAVNAWGFIR